MAHTATNIVRVKTGNRTLVFCKFIFDTSYATGGEAIDPALLGLNKIDAVVASDAAVADGTTGFGVAVNSADEATWKLVMLGATAAAGAGDALTENDVADQSAKSCRIVVAGY